MAATLNNQAKIDFMYQELIDGELGRLGSEIGKLLRPRFDIASTEELEVMEKMLSSINQYVHFTTIKRMELIDSGEVLSPCIGCGNKFCRDENCQ